MAGVELLFGPMLIGVYLNTILYGVLVVQMFIYYRTYKNDKPWIRYFILYLFVMETANTGFDIGMMYEPLVVRYATPRATLVAPIMLSLDAIITAAISTPVQFFYAWRIKVISGSKLIASIICFLALCSFVGSVGTTVCVTLIPEYKRFQQFNGTIITWLVSSTVADVVITGSLVYFLYHRKTGIKATDDVINRIMLLTVQTGLITAVSAAADVIIFLALPTTTLNFVWDFALSKLYTNSLLSTLNARAGWRNSIGNPDQPNVLFGEDHTNTMTRISRSRLTDQSDQQKAIGVYELEPRSRSSLQSNNRTDPDLEYGVSVIRAVE